MAGVFEHSKLSNTEAVFDSGSDQIALNSKIFSLKTQIFQFALCFLLVSGSFQAIYTIAIKIICTSSAQNSHLKEVQLSVFFLTLKEKEQFIPLTLKPLWLGSPYST